MYQKSVLDNGLRVVSEEMPHTHSVSILIFVGVGSRYETDKEAGISHFIEHLMFKGTPKRPTSREISEAIEGVGGILNAGTDRELTMYWCKVARQHFDMTLDVLTDMLFHSKFDPVELERERQVIIEEIHLSDDAPEQRVNMLVDRLLFPDHPLGRDVAGDQASVSGLTRDMITGFIANKYQARNTVVAVAGNIKHEEVVAAVSKSMTEWAKPVPNKPVFETFTPRTPPSRLLIESKDIEQTHFCLALPGISLVNPQRYALDLLNVTLGEGMSSRLFIEVRDKLGLTYSIHSSMDHLADTGAIVISAAVTPENLPKTIEATLKEFAKIKVPISIEEHNKAREQTKGRLLLRMEDSRSVASWMGIQELLQGRIKTVEDIVAIIDAITINDLQKVANDMFRNDQLRLAVVGPVRDRKPLEQLLGM